MTLRLLAIACLSALAFSVPLDETNLTQATSQHEDVNSLAQVEEFTELQLKCFYKKRKCLRPAFTKE